MLGGLFPSLRVIYDYIIQQQYWTFLYCSFNFETTIVVSFYLFKASFLYCSLSLRRQQKEKKNLSLLPLRARKSNNQLNTNYKEYSICMYTVGENIIATTKIRNDYGAIQSFIFQYWDSNIGLSSIAPCKVITLCILFGISSSFLMASFLKLSLFQRQFSPFSLLKAIAIRLRLLFSNSFN